MSNLNRDHLWETWWIDRATIDQMVMVGAWDQKSPAKFEIAWAEFQDEVLRPTAYETKNAWTMDIERQQVFVDYLMARTELGFSEYLDRCFEEYCQERDGIGFAGGCWGVNDSN